MTCNYFDYRDMTDKMFYGVALTDNYLNNVSVQIKRYLQDGGAGDTLAKLGIGFRIVEKQFVFPELNETISQKFVWLNGERKGEELTIDEIKGIGMFLKHGAFYGKINNVVLGD